MLRDEIVTKDTTLDLYAKGLRKLRREERHSLATKTKRQHAHDAKMAALLPRGRPQKEAAASEGGSFR